MLGVKFIGADFKLSIKEKTNKLCHYLPYNFLIGGKNDGIVLLKPGALMKTYTFICPDLGSASAESINLISSYFNDGIRRLGSGWAVHFEVRREFTKDYPGSKWDNQLGYLIDARRKDLYQNQNEHFLNYFFLTLSYAVKSDLVTKGSKLLYKKDNSQEDEYYNTKNVGKEIQLFRDRAEEFISYVSSRISIEPLDDDTTVTYIHSCLGTKWEERLAPRQPVFFDSFIADQKVQTGDCMKIGDMYCPIIEIRDFPTETYPAIFNLLNNASVQYRWVTRWIGMDKDIATKLITKYQKHFNNSRKSWGQAFVEAAGNVSTDRVDPTAIAFEEDTNNAKVHLAKDIVSFGYYTSCIEVWDKDYNVAMDKANYIAGLVNSCTFSAKPARSNSFQAWLGMLPGNNYANVHKTLVSSGNMSHIIPLSSCWTGDFYNRWTDECIGCGAPLLTASSYGSPFFINLNVGDVFHTFIFGPSGAGKSTFLCLLESQFLKYKDAQIIILDKDKSARGVCMGAGGSYIEPGLDSIAFQPLRELETNEQMTWATEFIQQCLNEQHIIITSEHTEAIRNALIQLRDTKSAERRDITTFQQYVQHDEVRIGIQPYTLDGQYGQIFDAHGTALHLSSFTMIEMGVLMRLGSACVTPALMYIFRFIEDHFAKENDNEGHPTLLVLDEAWVFLDNDYFSTKIAEWLTTLRKKRVAVVFATQEVAKAAKAKISTTIISQCQTRFYLADPNATSAAISPYYTEFGLEQSELQAVAEARMKRDYFYKSPNGARMFQLELDPFQLALISPPKQILDKLEQKYGRNSGVQLASEILSLQGFHPEKYFNQNS